ncbi:hypothetical protein D1P53_005982 [Cryptococcus gattii VGV]|nr:hypothetical protein D1P53_005982 [Cryptococcus gattii VGV]
MGVKGLWSLLNPVARPVQIESMEGKRLAIDSSIWLYQFQATMRDKDGRVLVNAHVLVFVFDGGAPALKRSTIAERKRKKTGAAANHAKVAEKLFAAQMRREAVKAAQVAHEQKEAKAAAEAAAEYARRYPDEAGEQIAEGAVYLEDLEGRAGPSRPRSPQPRQSEDVDPSAVPTDPEKRRRYFKKHDPYRLPAAEMPTVSTSERPDARLATEEELKQFIDEVHPEDIDIESPEFRALPTEVQYEIIGDLRIRSRQQSHRRLADMLRAAPTPLDFSKAQIKHLSQRNALTQQLLTVTDMVGKAHLTIPVRIAAERNREYVLVKKDETEGGGWALGIREGSKEKPIEIESAEPKTESDHDSDVEPVSPPPQAAMDQDLREYRRKQVLEAIAARYAPKRPARAPLDVAVKPFGPSRTASSKPLFDVDGEGEEEEEKEIVPTANDEALALALQQEELGEDETEADGDLAKALALSRREAERRSRSESEGFRVGDVGKDELTEEEEEDGDMEEVELVPSGTVTPAQIEAEEEDSEDEDEFEEVDTASTTLSSARVSRGTSIAQGMETPGTATSHSNSTSMIHPIIVDDDDDEGDQVLSTFTEKRDSAYQSDLPEKSAQSSGKRAAQPVISSRSQFSPSSTVVPVRPKLLQRLNSAVNVPSPLRHVAQPKSSPISVVDDDGAPVPVGAPAPSLTLEAAEPAEIRGAPSFDMIPPRPSPPPSSANSPAMYNKMDEEEEEHDEEDEDGSEGDVNDETRSTYSWSRSPTPPPRPLRMTETEIESQNASPFPSHSHSHSHSHSPALNVPRDDDEDDGNLAPADMAAESDDYARFVASIKHRDLNEVRGEIDDEIRVLNSENRVAMRDSDEITSSMIAQIQTLLRHFGIPYITAPMEAEAQCAKLAQLGLVDGIITDDSDVFLFGGVQCFKNIFNDAKYAECFLLADVERELMLTRERLISLAYFLGSDYTLGLPGIGPVMGLEILANFPGERGLYDFKEWWGRVQRGDDTERESGTRWRKSFKKRFLKSIYLTADWPDPLVREAYLYPTVDESEEPFHWGFPRLSALRTFLHEELSWSISKVDDELTPIVQRISLRGKHGALNKQGTLDPFFDLSAGAGQYYAPRRRDGGGGGGTNVSKRLMGVIKQFKEAEARISRGEDVDAIFAEEENKAKGKRKADENGDGDGEGEGEDESRNKKKKTSARGRMRAGTASSVGNSVESSEGTSRSTSTSRRGRRGSRGRGRARGKSK